MNDKPYPFNADQEAWLRDLETTEEPQTQGYLHVTSPMFEGERVIPSGFCCLGRACVALGLDRFQVDPNYADSPAVSYVTHGASSTWGSLPIEGKRQLRLISTVGEFVEHRDGFGSLTQMNDDGKSFKEIAAYIRSDPWNVFLPPEEAGE